jgi:sugar phosphate isomerase/epimerase
MVDQFLEIDLSRIIHVHLHDNHGKKDEHLSLGKGNIDWKKVLRKLQNFKGRLVAEARTVGEGAESLKYIKECL